MRGCFVTGCAAHFEVQNAASAGRTAKINTKVAGDDLLSITTGAGRAGFFRTTSGEVIQG